MRLIHALMFVAIAASACTGTSPVTPTKAEPDFHAPGTVVSGALNLMLSGFTTSFNNTNSSRSNGPIAPRINVFVQPPDTRQPCPGGGYISASSTMSGVLSNTTGNGTLSWVGYQSFINCDMGGGWVMRSNPYESTSGTVNIFGGRLSLTVKFGGGGDVYLNDRRAGSYYWNGVLLQWDSLTGWSNSGQFCTTPGPVCAHF
jgi:hypothetical protein